MAYFNPAQIRHPDGSTSRDSAGSYAHYDAASGYIWLATSASGFWVLEVQPQVREHLGLDESSGWRPGDGRPPGAGKPDPPGRPEAPIARIDTPPAKASGFAPTAGVPPAGLAIDSAYDQLFNYCRL